MAQLFAYLPFPIFKKVYLQILKQPGQFFANPSFQMF